jgi:Xaa-Pro aminopeptidase
VEWLLIADPRHIQYLANFWVQPLSFSGGERGLLLLERNGRATLLADNFTIRSAAGQPYVDREVVERWYDHRHSVINRDQALLQALNKVALELQERPGMAEAEWLTAAAAAILLTTAAPDTDTLVGLGGMAESGPGLGSILRRLRRQKEPDELDLLRDCVRAGEAGHARMREILRPGLSEFEIYRDVQQAALAAAGRPGLVYGDFRATNGSAPKVGGLPTGYRLQSGDLFILDYSVVLDGYRADFTNTYAVGEPSGDLRGLMELCQGAMAAGEALLRAGTPCRDVYAAVAGPFRHAGRAELFPHHAGHGLGLAHPEPPILVPESTDTLRAGDVVTLEPGAYQEGVGGMRIEHNYLITESGYERLTHHEIGLT